jgi:hypothetical protein
VDSECLQSDRDGGTGCSQDGESVQRKGVFGAVMYRRAVRKSAVCISEWCPQTWVGV